MSSQHHNLVYNAANGPAGSGASGSGVGAGTGDTSGGGGGSQSLSNRPTISHHHSHPSCGAEIDLTALLSDQMAALGLTGHYADIVFLVDDARLPAHRTILAARSDYFRAMLFGGGFVESTQTEIRLDIPLAPFRTLLRYIYSGHMSLASLSVEHVLDTFGLAHQYGFGALELAISEYLRGVLSIENVCAILDAASLYNLDELSEVCLTFMDQNAGNLLQHETFGQLSKHGLCALLRRDSFFAPEVQIFSAVHEWSRHNGGEDVAEVVGLVRLSLMNMEQLLKVVRPSGILHPDRLLDVFEEKTTAKRLNYRGALWPGENVASQKFGTQVVQGEFRQALLDDDCTGYDMDKGYTRHMITDDNDQGIIVELGTISIINHLKLLLWDRDNRSYFYYVEVSVNLTQWERVVDHTEYNCRSWQWMYFPARAVKYVKLVGTHNTENKIFHAVSLQAMFVERPPQLVGGFVAPRQNVATVERSAIVVRGVSRCRNVLINGDCTTYDWDSGYTCHQLGSGEILIQLGQPYWLSSMRILLWDCDDRAYSFYVETSTNMRQWDMAVDRRTQMLKSWQVLAFTARPVVFVKIVGTFNTANEIFHCVHFECPSQVEPPPLQPLDAQNAAAAVANAKAAENGTATNNEPRIKVRVAGEDTAEDAANAAASAPVAAAELAAVALAVAAPEIIAIPAAIIPEAVVPVVAEANAMAEANNAIVQVVEGQLNNDSNNQSSGTGAPQVPSN